jgi:hypothetical protein
LSIAGSFAYNFILSSRHLTTCAPVTCSFSATPPGYLQERARMPLRTANGIPVTTSAAPPNHHVMVCLAAYVPRNLRAQVCHFPTCSSTFHPGKAGGSGLHVRARGSPRCRTHFQKVHVRLCLAAARARKFRQVHFPNVRTHVCLVNASSAPSRRS